MSGALRQFSARQAVGVDLPAVGDAFMGGFFAGIIDTTKGNIIAGDQYQTGARYALIVSPKSLESGTTLRWRTSRETVAAAQTRWDGLSAQNALASTTYPAFNYCAGLSYPSDGGSKWYLPALDEFELLYRHFKPTTQTNEVASRTGHSFPGGSLPNGSNISSDPQGAAYTSGNPGQTPVTTDSRWVRPVRRLLL